MSSERMLTCKELTEVLTDYLEGVMAPEERARFDAHLELCDGCANYVSQMRQTIRVARELRATDVGGDGPRRGCSVVDACLPSTSRSSGVRVPSG